MASNKWLEPSEEDKAAGRTELLTVELDEEDISLLERLAAARGVTQAECLRQLVIEACQDSPDALAEEKGGVA